MNINMAPNTTFESLNVNPFILNDSLNDKSQDPDVNFFHDNISSLDRDYISLSNFNVNFRVFTENLFCSKVRTKRYGGL